jgi:hypothetical protein
MPQTTEIATAHPGKGERADAPQAVSADDEIVWGAAAIGRVIGRSERQVFYLAEIGAIPVRRIGGRLCGRKSRLSAIADV